MVLNNVACWIACGFFLRCLSSILKLKFHWFVMNTRLKHWAGGSRALRKAFTDVDLDGNGQLDYYELCQALKVISFFRLQCLRLKINTN